MGGRSICGSVQRRKSVDYGQCVHLKLISAPNTLNEFEDQFFSDPVHFSYEPEAPVATRCLPTNRQFTILQSGAGAT